MNILSKRLGKQQCYLVLQIVGVLFLCAVTCLLPGDVANQDKSDNTATTPGMLVSAERKPSSSRGLKEGIGEAMKESLEACASLAAALGQLQVEVAALQKRLLTTVEPLLDNQPPFKKASKEQLGATLDVLKDGSKKIREQVQEAHALRKCVARDFLLVRCESAINS